jgi:hypothetical protein
LRPTSQVEQAGQILQGYAGMVEWLVADLATVEGVDKLLERVRDRPVDALACQRRTRAWQGIPRPGLR